MITLFDIGQSSATSRISNVIRSHNDKTVLINTNDGAINS